MKWLVVLLMAGAGAVLAPLLLLMVVACFMGSALLASCLALAGAVKRPYVYNNRH